MFWHAGTRAGELAVFSITLIDVTARTPYPFVPSPLGEIRHRSNDFVYRMKKRIAIFRAWPWIGNKVLEQRLWWVLLLRNTKQPHQGGLFLNHSPGKPGIAGANCMISLLRRGGILNICIRNTTSMGHFPFLPKLVDPTNWRAETGHLFLNWNGGRHLCKYCVMWAQTKL